MTNKQKKIRAMLNNLIKMGYYHGEYMAMEGSYPPEIRGQDRIYKTEIKIYRDHILGKFKV